MDDALLMKLFRAYRAVALWPEESPDRWHKMIELRAAVEAVLTAEGLVNDKG